MKTKIIFLKQILQNLNNGIIKDIEDINTNTEISYIALDLINNINWDDDSIYAAKLILEISNIAYNNTSLVVLPLDDGVYDQLAVLYYRYDKNYQVGAKPIHFDEAPTNEIIDDKIMCTIVNTDSDNMYVKDIWKQNVPMSQMPLKTMCTIIEPPITKRLINTEHKYPELVGTLDKCKFVLNIDAKNAGVLDKESVQIFERDFIGKCISSGVISLDEEFGMVGELKYDGISVEAEICGDTIIKALSRGDTADNIATDLTPIFKGYKFPNAKDRPKDIVFGMKFEAVITYRNLETLGRLRGKVYKNARNAIIGLCGASDAHQYANLITLIPIATSLDMDRLSELNFINTYYHSGEYNRFALFYGNYISILYQVNQFTKSAEEIRNALPYMIDGVVVSFYDKHKKEILGRVNSVNKYSMAIKFNPREVRTNFVGYSYSIGKSGDIIPMVHFKPCEFIGGIHTKQTIHSYKRFMELGLRLGEEIDVKYVNDVITYITKPDTEFNRSIKSEPVPFITNCPCCGTPLEISESGKSAKCPNFYCYERAIMRMVDLVDRLGFKDFSEERIRALNLTSFDQLMRLTMDKVKILGPINSSNLLKYISDLKQSNILDYKIMSALSFDGMADETWKIIFSEMTLKEMYSIYLTNSDYVNIYCDRLTKLNGIGLKTINALIDGLYHYDSDIEYIVGNLNIIDSKNIIRGPRIALTGFRDAEYVKLLCDNGFDANDKYTVTKDTIALITSDKNSTSSKIQKAKKYNIPIYSKQEFLEYNNISV